MSVFTAFVPGACCCGCPPWVTLNLVLSGVTVCPGPPIDVGGGFSIQLTAYDDPNSLWVVPALGGGAWASGPVGSVTCDIYSGGIYQETIVSSYSFILFCFPPSSLAVIMRVTPIASFDFSDIFCFSGQYSSTVANQSGPNCGDTNSDIGTGVAFATGGNMTISPA